MLKAKHLMNSIERQAATVDQSSEPEVSWLGEKTYRGVWIRTGELLAASLGALA
jgi:hypothetical protein